MPDQESIQIPLEWEPDDDKPIHFANHLLVISDGDNVILRFYQALPPATNYGAPDALKNIASVKARHVVTLAISPGSYRSIVEVLMRHLPSNPNQ